MCASASDPHLHDLPSPHDSLHELLHGFLHAGWGHGLPTHEADSHTSKLCVHFLYQLQEGLAVLTQPCSLLFGKGHASMWQCHDEGISALSICAAEVKSDGLVSPDQNIGKPSAFLYTPEQHSFWT